MCLSPRPEAEQRKAFRHVLSSRLELGMVVRSPPSLSSVGNWDGFCFPQAACLCSFRIGPSNSMFLKLCAVGCRACCRSACASSCFVPSPCHRVSVKSHFLTLGVAKALPIHSTAPCNGHPPPSQELLGGTVVPGSPRHWNSSKASGQRRSC